MVGGDDYLSALGDKFVKRVEKLFLYGFLVLDKLNVVYDKHVRVAVILAQSVAPVARVESAACEHSVDYLVYELFASNVNYFKIGLFLDYFIGDCLYQVGFAESRSAVDEKGVIRPRGVVCNGKRCGVNEFVVLADYEIVESEPRVEVGGGRVCILVGRVICESLAALDFQPEIGEPHVGFNDGFAHFLRQRARNIFGKAFGRGFKHDKSPVHVDGHKLFYIGRVIDVGNEFLHLFLYRVV